jgi:CBS domain-containing protein
MCHDLPVPQDHKCNACTHFSPPAIERRRRDLVTRAAARRDPPGIVPLPLAALLNYGRAEGSAMQVQQLMTPAPRACAAGSNLAEAMQMMWEGDFGLLPVVDDDGRVTGVVTDRDIAVALGTRGRPAGEVTVADVMSRAVHICHPRAGIGSALEQMRQFRVRRLPVVDDEGRLCGMLSLNDVVLAAGSGVPAKAVMETIRGICEHQAPSGTPLVSAA